MISKLIFPLSIVALLFFLLSCGASRSGISETNKSNEVLTEDDRKSVFEMMKENDDVPIDERITLYYQLKENQRDEYNFDNEQELNRYGYELMSQGKIKESIKIFKLLVAEFPDSSNPYDSLGEAYQKDGNEELALINYEKSVELNPENYHAVDQITIMKGLEILVTDWGKEFFHFPLHFAPEIPYEGVEEVVFPKNWIKPDSADFWSYVGVWELDHKKRISQGELESVFQQYFDGLMKVVNDDENARMMETTSHFYPNKDPNDNADLMGDLTIFDAFATKKPLDLKAKVFTQYCEDRDKLIVLFHFSPQDYSHWVWSMLSVSVQLRETICVE